MKLLAKAVISLPVEETTTSFQFESYYSTVDSGHTSSNVKEEMELDIPGKKNSFLSNSFIREKVRNSFPGNMAVSFIILIAFPGIWC